MGWLVAAVLGVAAGYYGVTAGLAPVTQAAIGALSPPAVVAPPPARAIAEAPVAVAVSKPVVVLPSIAITDDDRLRARIRWVQARVGRQWLPTPDAHSRLMLAKSAAERARLHEVGLGFRDVYGVISAETSWVPRTGAGKDGTPSFGVAQFEPATARALGVRNPDDLVEAVHGAAVLMKEAALWSGDRVARLKLSVDERAARFREGISIYYNLSSRGRAVWNGRNTRKLPIETRQHIANAREGAQQAAMLETKLMAQAGGLPRLR